MKIALVNPPWSFDGSIYFGCREPHLPLEYGYARALLTDAGHDAAIFDAQVDGIDIAALAIARRGFRAGHDRRDDSAQLSVLALRAARAAGPAAHLGGARRARRANRRSRPARLDDAPRCGAQARRRCGRLGECEEVLVALADTPRDAWGSIAGLVRRDREDIVVQGGPQAVDMARLPALRWRRRHRAAARASPPSLRRCAAWPRRRNGGVARLPLSLHLLRQGQFPRPLPPPAACDDPRRARRADRRGRRLRLLHRRDLSAVARAARGARRAAGRIRRADAHRSVEPRHARPARSRGLRLDRGRGREPDAARARLARQGLQAVHRGIDATG